MDKPKICLDCEHCMTNSKLSPFCSKSEGLDLVTGEMEWSRARYMRSDKGECGLEAKFFEVKKLKEVHISKL